MIQLKRGREKSLKRRHPWIFSGAVEKASGKAGDTVEVLDAAGKFVARAAYSPKSQIRARVWSFDPKEEVVALVFCQHLPFDQYGLFTRFHTAVGQAIQ